MLPYAKRIYILNTGIIYRPNESMSEPNKNIRRYILITNQRPPLDTILNQFMHFTFYTDTRLNIPPAWGLGEGLTTPHRKNQFVTKCYTGPQNWRALVNRVMKLRVPFLH